MERDLSHREGTVMLVSAFTIVRNGMKFDYPFIESLKSVLPACDELVINVGRSEDSTLEAVERFKLGLSVVEAAKVKIFETEWPVNDAAKRRGGRILADQTNLALDRCQGRWCLYLQADEVLHEDDVTLMRAEIERLDALPEVEGLVFQYVHFYGTYDVIQVSRSSYRREVRVIRNGMGIRSSGDAQSFRHVDGRKLAAVLSRARVFHYGWVRPQQVMREKTAFMDTLYHVGATTEAPATGDNYLYKRIVGLKPFRGSHPAVMGERVRNAPHFDFSAAPRVFHLKDTWKLLSGWIEALTGHRPFEYKSYRLIKR